MGGDGVAAALGVDASERDAFAHLLRVDAARGFNVTLAEATASKIAIPALGVDESERRRAATRRSLLRSIVGGRACADDAACVAAAEMRVTVQATEAMAEGVVTSSQEREEKLADAETRAEAALARLVGDPAAFFAGTANTLGPGVRVAVVGNVTREERIPEPPAPFRDLFDMLPPSDRGAFFGLSRRRPASRGSGTRARVKNSRTRTRRIAFEGRFERWRWERRGTESYNRRCDR